MSNNMGKKQWFVVQTLSNQEKKVREAILSQLQLSDSISVFEVEIPTEKVSEVRNGKKTVTMRKLFPGYILINMALYDENDCIDDNVWYFIRNIQGVIGFVGGSDNPTPLSDAEVADLFRQSGSEEQIKPKIAYEVGEVVRIKSGAFENFEGTIDEVDNERGKLKLMVSIFGRSTPVELEFWQVDREI